MKRHAFSLVLGAAVVIALLSVSAGQSRSKDGTQPAPGVYTFDQAVKAGIVPSLQEELKQSGLPLCPPPSEGTGGYKSPEALKQAIEKAPEAPTCMADPRGATFSVCDASCAHSIPFAPPGDPSHAASQDQQSVIPAGPGAWPHVQ